MNAWYGYRSVIKNHLSEAEFNEFLEFVKPNGSNTYRTKNARLISRLPPSHVKVRIPFSEGDQVYQRSLLLQKQLNQILSPGTRDLVASVVYKDKSYIPVYADSSPITVHPRRLTKIREQLSKVPFAESQTQNDNSESDPCLVFDEAYIIVLSSGERDDELLLEYISKLVYIYGAARNQWLRPYANRIDWRIVNGVSSVTLPYWGTRDIENYGLALDASMEIQLPNPNVTYVPGSIKLSDAAWYQLPRFVLEVIDLDVLPAKNSSVLFFRGEDYNKEDVIRSSLPDIDWRLHNLARVSEQLTQGLLPFKSQYPDDFLDDAVQRLDFKRDSAGLAVVLKPNDLILGSHSSQVSEARARQFYTTLWEQGFFLTNYGHYNYEDSESPLDETGIRKLMLTDTMLGL